jgi:hypothetical protein
MKTGVLAFYSHFQNLNVINIGDYIQSLAQAQFFEKIDFFVPRENIKNFNANEKIVMILNGWFKDYAEDWPPNSCIDPLFTSFHITPKIVQDPFFAKWIEYFKQYTPIGCRDKETMAILQRNGVDAYFSGCLTLTLGEKYKTQTKTNEIYFVDTYIGNFNLIECLKNFICFFKITKLFRIWKTWKKQNYRANFITATTFKMVVKFYLCYSQKFSDEILLNAHYINHDICAGLFKNEQEKLDYAENLIKKYASAKLVVTSKIHCALPCLCLETPVIFVTDETDSFSFGRFDGLLDFFKILRISKSMKCLDYIEPKQNYVPIKNALIKRVKEFIQQKEKQ